MGGLPCPVCGKRLHCWDSRLEDGIRIRKYKKCKCGYTPVLTAEKFTTLKKGPVEGDGPEVKESR
jgi:hypothetical protein